GPIRIGRVQHGRAELGPVGLHPHELCSHVCVIGRTGVGKSTLAVGVLMRLLELGIPWVAFDTKRSLRQLLALETPTPIYAVAVGRAVGSTLHWNPLAPPPGIPADTHRRQIVELVCRTWGAGDAVAALLDRTIEQLTDGHTSVPTFVDVRRALVEAPLKQRESTWRQTALRVLDQLTTGPLGRAFNTRRDAVATDVLLERRTIVELDGLTGADGAFVISSLLQQLTARLQQDSTRASSASSREPGLDGLRLCMFIDEAHRLLARHDGGRETPVELLLREGRSLGLGLVLATQTYGGISPVALANCATWIALQCRYRSDVNTGAQGLMLRDDQKEILTTLPVGEAVVRLGSRYPHPVHVKLTPFDLPAKPVADLDLARAFLVGPFRRDALNIRAAVETAQPSPRGHRGDSAGPAHSAAVRPNAPEPGPQQAVPRLDSSHGAPAPSHGIPQLNESACVQTVQIASQDPDEHDTPSHREAPPGSGLDVDPDATLLLKSVAHRPLATVTQHYAAAQLPRRRGDAAKRALVQERYLKAIDVPVPEGRVVLLEPTGAGSAWLRRHRIERPAPRASLLHAYWQDRVGRELTGRGWQVELEHHRDGHAFDVFASRDRSTLLCEVETGKSNVPANLAALTAANVDHRVVLWLDPLTIDRARVLVPDGVTLLQPRSLPSWLATIRGSDNKGRSVAAGRAASR
ncbi:MAG: ATP-binding protein, partial [Phycisphaerales bacterium]